MQKVAMALHKPSSLLSQKMPLVIYVAKKHIPEGAQLLVNYGESYWENRGQLPMQLGNPTEEEICEAEEDDCHHEKLEALLRVMTTLESPELIGLK